MVELKTVFSCHFCIPNVISQTYSVINCFPSFKACWKHSFEKAKWKTLNNNHHHNNKKSHSYVENGGLAKCSFQAFISGTNYLPLNTLIVISYLLASVNDFRVKHNKSTVPCVVSFTYWFYRIDLPSKPSLGSGPIKQCVSFSNGWPVIKSLAWSVWMMHHLSHNYTISTWMQPLWESHRDWKSLKDIKNK